MEEVALHQRARLHEAMVELTAERGYDGVSVTGLAKRARVSKRDFYKHFSSKEECLLATYDLIVNHSVRGIHAAIAGEDEWRERLRLGYLTLAGQIADNPEAARLALVEAFAAGAGAIERLERTNRLFEALVATGLARGEGSPRLPRLLVKGITAACGRVARAALLSGDPRPMLRDEDELTEWVLSLCDDPVARLCGLGAAGASPLPVNGAEPPFGDERAMILSATARLASREGYATLTVPRVRAAAGVSGRSFYAHFDGVDDCFLAALEMLSNRTLAAAKPSYLTGEDWASGVHHMVVRLCRQLAGDPDFANLVFREALSSGPEADRWRGEKIAKLATLLRRGAPPEQRPTEFAAEASIGAMWGVIHHFVSSGSGAQLPIAAPVLSYIALAPAIGAAAAIDAMVAGPAGPVQRWKGPTLDRNPPA